MIPNHFIMWSIRPFGNTKINHSKSLLCPKIRVCIILGKAFNLSRKAHTTKTKCESTLKRASTSKIEGLRLLYPSSGEGSHTGYVLWPNLLNHSFKPKKYKTRGVEQPENEGPMI